MGCPSCGSARGEFLGRDSFRCTTIIDIQYIDYFDYTPPPIGGHKQVPRDVLCGQVYEDTDQAAGVQQALAAEKVVAEQAKIAAEDAAARHRTEIAEKKRIAREEHLDRAPLYRFERRVGLRVVPLEPCEVLQHPGEHTERYRGLRWVNGKGRLNRVLDVEAEPGVAKVHISGYPIGVGRTMWPWDRIDAVLKDQCEIRQWRGIPHGDH